MPQAVQIAHAGGVRGKGIPKGSRSELVPAGSVGVLDKVVRYLVSVYTSAGRRRNRPQRPDRSLQFFRCPGEGSLAPGRDVPGALEVGQVADRGFLDEHGGQGCAMAEPGRVHRRTKDRLPIGVAAQPFVAVQQVGYPGQVLSDLPIVAFAGSRLGRFGQRWVAGASGGGQVGGRESVRHVDHSAAGWVNPRRGTVGQFLHALQQQPDRPSRVSGSGPGGGCGGIGVPVLGPHGRDGQAAIALQQVGQAAQHRRAPVGVSVLAQLTEPQHGTSLDAVLQPISQRARVQRIIQPPVRQNIRDRLIGGPGLAGRGSAAYHHQPARGYRRVQDSAQQLIMRPADIR